jgi:hypothetical protein
MEDKCALCKGMGKFMKVECGFCNGTGEYNKAADSYVKNYHVCGCVATDRKNCPVCGQKCHHKGSQSPKITISPIM